jgi:hypothetical protein
MRRLVTYGIRLCDSCEHIHFDLFDKTGTETPIVTMSFDDQEWDELFISVAKMRRVREARDGVKTDG